MIGKFVCTATTLASGIPLGREGPSVQVGAIPAAAPAQKRCQRPPAPRGLHVQAEFRWRASWLYRQTYRSRCGEKYIRRAQTRLLSFAERHCPVHPENSGPADTPWQAIPQWDQNAPPGVTAHGIQSHTQPFRQHNKSNHGKTDQCANYQRQGKKTWSSRWAANTSQRLSKRFGISDSEVISAGEILTPLAY